MKRITFWGLMAVVCCLFAAPIPSFASGGMQPYVVASDLLGSGNFAMSNGDGTLSEQQAITRFAYGSTDWTRSNGVGDFNGDGVLDIVLVVVNLNPSGIDYIFGKIENNQFVEQSRKTESNTGKYPGRMVIADFDEDGYLDFIMPYDGSTDCNLYKGQGDFEFTSSLLPGTSPLQSIAADVGDFNGDGHADFIAGSYGYGQTYINYGNGKGEFDTKVIYLDYAYYYGFTSVAAADFNGDGLDDFVISLNNVYLYFYFSSRNDPSSPYVQFNYSGYLADGNFYQSPIDAYDLDDDGNQDLIIGGYGNGGSYTGIAVMLGNGNGTFNSPVVYGGDTEGLELITCVSAPTPFQPPPIDPNAAPVAVLYCDPYEVAAGDPVFIDGQDSYDEDGEIVSYQWNFGDDNPDQKQLVANAAAEESATAEHVYYDVGTFTITLTVTDDQGASGVAEVTVKVKPQEAQMIIFPRTLNLKSKERWIHAWVKLPALCDAGQVDVKSINILDEKGEVLKQVEGAVAVQTSEWMAKHNRFYLKFDRQAVIELISGDPSSQTTFQVEGIGGFPFQAVDTIRTIDPSKKEKEKKNKKSDRNRGRRRGHIKNK